MSRGGTGSDNGLRELVLVLGVEPDTDPELADRSARRLHAELSTLDIESIRWASTAFAPPLAKGIDPAELTALLITLSDPGGLLTRLIEIARDWLARTATARRISVTIDGDTIELDRASLAERSALIEAYIRRHEVD